MTISVQVLSLVGAGLILAAFFRLQRGLWHQTASAYLWFNLVGASLLTVVAVYDRRIGFIVLEGVWASVSLWSLLRVRRGAADPRVGGH